MQRAGACAGGGSGWGRPPSTAAHPSCTGARYTTVAVGSFLSDNQLDFGSVCKMNIELFI